MQITIKLRIRDKHASGLKKQAQAVNFTWNYCNEVQQRAAQAHRKWLSSYHDLRSIRMPRLGLAQGDIEDLMAYVQSKSFSVAAGAHDTHHKKH